MKNKLLNRKKIAQLFYLFTFLVLCANTAMGQNPVFFTSGDYTPPNSWSGGTATTTIVGTNIHTATPNGLGLRYFRFYSGANATGSIYGPTSASVTLTSGATATTTQSGNATFAYGLNIGNASSNVVFKTSNGAPGVARVWATEVQGPVRTITPGTTQLPLATRVNALETVNVTRTLSGALSTGQRVYIRYTRDAFATSTVVQGVVTNNTTATFTIPGAFNTASAVVAYYLFSSGATTPTAADADLMTINLDNNSGANYTYTVGAAATTYPYVSAGAGTAGAYANYGSGATWIGGVAPPSAGNCVISAGDFVTVTSNTRSQNTTTTVNGAFSISGTLIVGSGTNALTFGVGGTLTVLSTGTYRHLMANNTGGTLPTATWNTGSTCNLQTNGAFAGSPGNLGQAFHHLIFNFTTLSSASNISSSFASASIGGDFTINSTNLFQLRLGLNTPYTLNVGGNFLINSAALVALHLSTTAGSTNAAVVNVAGNFTQIAGSTLTLSSANSVSLNHPSTATLNVAGNVSLDGAIVLSTSNGAGTINQTRAAPTFGFSQTAGSIDFGTTTGTAGVGAINVTGTFSRTGTGTMTTSGTAAPNGKITFNGGASQTLTNTTSGAAGKVDYQINSGSTVTLLSDLPINSVASTTSVCTVVNGGILTLGGFNLTVSDAGNSTVAGIISGTGALVKTGAGTLTLTAASGNNTASTYSGATTISAASSGVINVTGLTNVTSTSIARDAQSVDFSSPTPTNGTYKLFPNALTVNTQSFSSDADASKVVTFDYANSTVTVASATITMGTVSPTAYLAGTAVSVPFATTGTLTGTYTAQLSDASGSFASPVAIGTGTASPISATIPGGTTPGTGYRIRVVSLTIPITGTANASDIAVSTTTWTSSWNLGAPTAELDAVIAGNYATESNGAITARNLTVNDTRTLTVNSSATVTVAGALVSNGSIVVENNAQLIQTAGTDTNSGSGSVTVNRDSNNLKRLDYTLWSTPIKTGNRTLASFSPLTTPSRNYTYNPGTNVYNSVGNTGIFSVGTGYLIRMPDVLSSGPGANLTNYYTGSANLTFNGVFTGTALNNGPITVNTTASAFNAVGNPYPSTISANTFLSVNGIASGTLYFWRKTNNLNQATAATTSYASYTSEFGGVANGGFTPSATIQVGQGFIVQAPGASVVFNNTMRAGVASTEFMKTKAQAEKSRIWLNLNNGGDMLNQTLIGYMAGATLGVDNGIDGKSFGDGAIELASNIDGASYTIQGRPAFDANDVVSLNFKTSIAGTYSIAIDHVDGLFSRGQDIYLVDKTAGTTTNLNEGTYTFTAAVGVDNTRFTLTYQKTLKVDAPLFNENSVLVSRSNGTINVKSSAVAINNVKVYDIQGRLVAERKNVKSNTATISNVRANQVLIVKVTAENNAVVTKKVLN